jgi:hypothetical protein
MAGIEQTTTGVGIWEKGALTAALWHHFEVDGQLSPRRTEGIEEKSLEFRAACLAAWSWTLMNWISALHLDSFGMISICIAQSNPRHLRCSRMIPALSWIETRSRCLAVDIKILISAFHFDIRTVKLSYVESIRSSTRFELFSLPIPSGLYHIGTCDESCCTLSVHHWWWHPAKSCRILDLKRV